MIIKLDHLAFASKDIQFEQQIKLLKDLGYELKFVAREARNLNIKFPLMKVFSPRQDLALLVSENNINIELVNHSHSNKNFSNITPLFKNIPHRLIKSDLNLNLKNKSERAVEIKYFEIPVYVSEDKKNKSFIFNELIIKTANIEESISFWKNFAFSPILYKKNSAVLEFNAPLGRNTHHLRLIKDKKINIKIFLDDIGFNCLAFVSNSAKNEKKSLEMAGIKTTPIERFKVNNKKLEIFFASGRQGEIVEIIGPIVG